MTIQDHLREELRRTVDLDMLHNDAADKIDALEAEIESLQLRNQELADDKEVLLGHMVTIRNVTNDPAISMLANVVLERMAQKGEQV